MFTQCIINSVLIVFRDIFKWLGHRVGSSGINTLAWLLGDWKYARTNCQCPHSDGAIDPNKFLLFDFQFKSLGWMYLNR